MPGLDETREFVPLKFAVLTVSDSRSLKDDKSGALLVQRIGAAGHLVAERSIVPDDIEAIRARVKAWIADPVIDVIITTGGTGFTGRDVTPEAIEPLFDKKMDAFSVLFLVVSFPKIGTSAIQSRATAGLAGVWANNAQSEYHVIDQGDVEKAVATAQAIGDDRLQKETQGYVVPDAFTHGTSAQRKRWFSNGFSQGKVSACDTLSANSL